MSDISITGKLSRKQGRAVIRLASANRKYRTEEERIEARRAYWRERQRRRRQGWQVLNDSHYVKPQEPPPGDVLAERECVYAPPRSLTAFVCGDPPPGRSALDQREGDQASQ